MANKIDFSVIVTVLNEEKSIIPLLNSFAIQKRQPREVLIVDAGSKDTTIHRISKWKEDNPDLKVRILRRKGTNRSEGRNIAIEEAVSNFIAVTDAGCETDRDWLWEMEQYYLNKPGIESVAGFYLPVTHSLFQQCLAHYVAVLPENLNPKTFLPSSRSISFTKEAWRKARKYPEHLDTCEDLVFAARLRDVSKMYVNPKAIVYWHIEDSVIGFINQIARYAEGDVRAAYWPHVRKIITVYLRYTLFSLYPPLFILYLFYPAVKHGRSTYRDGSFFVMPLVQLLADMGVMWGGFKGFWKFVLGR